MAASQTSSAPSYTSAYTTFLSSVEGFADSLSQLESEIPADQVPVHGDRWHQQVLAAFEKSQAACREFETTEGITQPQVLEAQKLFRDRTAHWMEQSWIAHRSRTKPSGFAGDYEMLVKLYEEATPACGLGGYIDLCILDLPLARAVRARMASVRSFLLTELGRRDGDAPVRILDIASGPCREFLDWPAASSQRVEVVALDNDPQAIDYVSQHVKPQLPDSTTMSMNRYNALRTRSAENTIRHFGKFDVIYSVGLCDYLTDEHLVGLLHGWGETLNEQGVLYIAFKDTEQYDQTPYQWHLDWFFYQRTLQDVLRLYEQAGFNVHAMDTVRDATQIIVNFVARKVPGAIVRLDSAEAQPRRRRAPGTVGTKVQSSTAGSDEAIEAS